VWHPNPSARCLTTVSVLVAGKDGSLAESACPDHTSSRNCPAINLVHEELYTVFKHIILNYSLKISDGEKEFHAVDSCADGLEFNQAPKQFRIQVQVRDQKLDAYLATEFSSLE